MKYGGIILAGGSGTRFGGDTPKQFIKLNGKTVLEYSLDVFIRCCDITIVVAHPEWIEETKRIVHGYGLTLPVTAGGKTRQESCINGLKLLEGYGIETVAIHDGARPFLSDDLLKKVLEKASVSGAAIPALPVNYSICRAERGKINGYVDRDNLFIIQTPQAFNYDLIYKAHLEALKQNNTVFTDDSRLLEKYGIFADIISGEEENIKITTQFDLYTAKVIINNKYPEV